jgi:hypothetical protein
MFDAPHDAWYVWLGVSVASLAVFGVVTAFPVAPVPDAPAVADTVDRVSATTYDTTASRTLDARDVRLEPHRIGLRNSAGTTHATLAYPVVPVVPGSPLRRLLHGAPPAAVFPSPAAFETATRCARDRDPRWHAARGRLVVTHVSWAGVDVTLVGTTHGAQPGTRLAPTTPTPPTEVSRS